MIRRNSIDFIEEKLENLSMRFKKKPSKLEKDYTKNYEDADILAQNWQVIINFQKLIFYFRFEFLIHQN